MNKILKKLSAGFMAGICAFSVFSGVKTEKIPIAEAALSTENVKFPSQSQILCKRKIVQ